MPISQFGARVEVALQEQDEKKRAKLIAQLKKDMWNAMRLADGRERAAAKVLRVSYPVWLNAKTKLGIFAEMAEDFPGRGRERHIELDGEAKTAMEWSKISGVPRPTIIERYKRGYRTKATVLADDLRLVDSRARDAGKSDQ
jgi:hypothetical protein